MHSSLACWHQRALWFAAASNRFYCILNRTPRILRGVLFCLEQSFLGSQSQSQCHCKEQPGLSSFFVPWVAGFPQTGGGGYCHSTDSALIIDHLCLFWLNRRPKAAWGFKSGHSSFSIMDCANDVEILILNFIAIAFIPLHITLVVYITSLIYKNPH